MSRDRLQNYIRYGTPKNFKYKYDEESQRFIDDNGRIYVPEEDKKLLIQPYIDNVKYTGSVKKLYATLKQLYGNISMNDIKKARLLNDNIQVLRQSKQKKYIKPIIVNGVNKVCQIDLIDMQKLSRDNSGARYILTAMDIFSKYADAIPLHDKTVKNVIEGMNSILERNEVFKFKKIQSDNGSEFKNQFEKAMLDDHGIHVFHSSAYMPQSQGVIERFNKTLKERLNFYMLQNDTKRWIDALDDVIYNHNHSVHSTTGVAPVHIYDMDDDQIEEIHKRIYKASEKGYIHNFKVGDVVRIHYKTKKEERKKGNQFKQSVQKWSKDLYSIYSITEDDMRPPEFELFNWYNKRIMRKKYYEHQLLKAMLPNGVSNVEDDDYDGEFHVIEL